MATSYEDFLTSPRVSYSGRVFNPIFPESTGWANVGVQGGGGIQYGTDSDGGGDYLRYFAPNGLMPFLSEQNGSLGYTTGQEYDDPQWNSLLDSYGNPISRQSLGLDKTYGYDSYENAKNTFSSGYVPWNIDNVNEGLSNRHPFNLNALWGGTQYAQGRVTDWSHLDPTQYQANVIAANTRNELWNEYDRLASQGKRPSKNPDEVALDFYVKNVGQGGNQFGYGAGANTALITEALKHQFLNSPDVVQARGTGYQTPQEKISQIEGFGAARESGVPTWQTFEQQQYGSGFDLGSLIPMIIGGMALGPMAGAFGGGLAGNALAGALIGGTTAEIGGGDFLKGALTGGVGGGLYSSLGGVGGDGWTSGYDLPSGVSDLAGGISQSNLTGLLPGYTDSASLNTSLGEFGGASSGASDFGLSGATTGNLTGTGGLGLGGVGSGSLGAGDLGAALGGEFSLTGGTAGNLAGTGGLSSAAGINGLGSGTGGLGLGSGAAGAAASGGSALLSPTLASAAGLGAAGLGSTGGGSLLGGSTAAPSAAASMGGAATGASTAASAGSALSRLFDGTATSADYAQLLGGVAGAGLGAYGANQQAQSYENIANKFMDMGQPYRNLLQQSYQPNFSMANQPDFMNALDIGSQAAARATSAKVGNPTGNPGAYADMQKYISGSLALPQLNTYRSQLGTFGQLGTNQAGSAMGAQTQAQGGMYDALGYGIGQVTQPDNPFKGLLDQFKFNSGRSF